MTDEPWTCGDGCPFRGCTECQYKGGDDPNTCAKTPVIWDNWSGKDERPAASTADRSEPPVSSLPKARAYPSW